MSERAPTFVQEHPMLGRFADLGDLILTGSAPLGVVDEYSYLDLELALSGDAVAQVDSATPTRYIEVPSGQQTWVRHRGVCRCLEQQRWRLMDHLAGDALRFPGPESDNALSQNFREIISVLIESARQPGIIQARSATSQVRW